MPPTRKIPKLEPNNDGNGDDSSASSTNSTPTTRKMAVKNQNRGDGDGGESSRYFLRSRGAMVVKFENTSSSTTMIVDQNIARENFVVENRGDRIVDGGGDRRGGDQFTGLRRPTTAMNLVDEPQRPQSPNREDRGDNRGGDTITYIELSSDEEEEVIEVDADEDVPPAAIAPPFATTPATTTSAPRPARRPRQTARMSTGSSANRPPPRFATSAERLLREDTVVQGGPNWVDPTPTVPTSNQQPTGNGNVVNNGGNGNIESIAETMTPIDGESDVAYAQRLQAQYNLEDRNRRRAQAIRRRVRDAGLADLFGQQRRQQPGTSTGGATANRNNNGVDDLMDFDLDLDAMDAAVRHDVDQQPTLEAAFTRFRLTLQQMSEVNWEFLDNALNALARAFGESLSQAEIDRIPTSVFKMSTDGAGCSSMSADESSMLTTCTICMDDFVEGTPLRNLPCSHSYHMDCIDKWLKQNATCPVCRRCPKINSKRP